MAGLLLGTGITSVLGPTIPTTGIFGSGGVFSLARTLRTLATVGSVAGKVQAVQTQAEATASASEYNASVSRENARITDEQTKAEVDKQKREAYLRAGANKARGGAYSGLTGSVLDILASNASQEELDIANIKQTGLLKQRGYLNEAQLDEANAKTTKKVAAQTNAATILGGIAKF